MKIEKIALDLYIDKIVKEHCIKLYENDFENIFKECCKLPKSETETTIDKAFEILEKKAFTNLKDRFVLEMFDLEITQKQELKHWQKCIDLFICRLSSARDEYLKEKINDYIGDFYHPTKKRLFIQGIVDEEGDFINGNS